MGRWPSVLGAAAVLTLCLVAYQTTRENEQANRSAPPTAKLPKAGSISAGMAEVELTVGARVELRRMLRVHLGRGLAEIGSMPLSVPPRRSAFHSTLMQM